MNKAKTKIFGKALVACLIINFADAQAQLKPKNIRVGFMNQTIVLGSFFEIILQNQN